jgi:hypothetical protein
MIQQKTLFQTVIFFALAILPVSAQVATDIEKRGTPVTSSEALQGDWTCVMTHRSLALEVIPSDKHLHNLRIIGDTVSYVEFPCRYYGTKVFTMDSLDYANPSLKDVNFLNDTLVVYSNSSESNGYRFYVRDTFDQKIMDALVQDTFYLPSLFGKWYLQTQDCMDYSGEAPWRVKYPVNLPRIYKLDKSAVVNKNTVQIKINGKLRKFNVVECSILEGYIELEAAGWHTSNFRVIYFNTFKAQDPCGNAIIYR